MDENNNLKYKKKIVPFNKIQGIAIKNEENSPLYFSQSYGSAPSKIIRHDPNKSWIFANKVVASTDTRGGQGIQFDKNNKLHGVSEAGSKYYQRRTHTTPWPKGPGPIYNDIILNE